MFFILTSQKTDFCKRESLQMKITVSINFCIFGLTFYPFSCTNSHQEDKLFAEFSTLDDRCMYSIHTLCFVSKRVSLKLKIWHKQPFCFLPMAIVLPAFPARNAESVKKIECAKFWTRRDKFFWTKLLPSCDRNAIKKIPGMP